VVQNFSIALKIEYISFKVALKKRCLIDSNVFV